MKKFNEHYHAKIAWNQQSNIPSMHTAVDEVNVEEAKLSKKDYEQAQKIVNDPKTKGGNYSQALKDLEKWKKGSTKDKTIAKMLYKAHNEQVHGYDNEPDKKKNESVEKSLEEAPHIQIELNWDMDDPREYQGDFQDVGVYLDYWDKRRSTILVSGDKKDLLKWLVNDYGFDKKDANDAIRTGKKVKESVEEVTVEGAENYIVQKGKMQRKVDGKTADKMKKQGWKLIAKEEVNVQEKGKYTNIWNKVKDLKGVSNKEKDMISNMDPSRLGDVVKALAPMFEEVVEASKYLKYSDLLKDYSVSFAKDGGQGPESKKIKAALDKEKKVLGIS